MKSKTQAISEFLDRQSLCLKFYKPELEVQVNVERNEEGATAFRIPFGSKDNPNYKDDILSWDLERYVEAIGLTGWNWFHKESIWVGFDFDSTFNHSQGLSDDEIINLISLLKQIPWVTLRRSKSGKGIHVYIFFEDPVKTENHTEHATLAKSILAMLSALLDFKFEDKVDTAGGVLWIWHRQASAEKKSFELIQEGEPLKYIPDNWKDYAPKKLRRSGISSPFEELVASTKKYKIEDGHRSLLFWLANQSNTWWWDAEKCMLVTHTVTLQQAHKELSMKGIYETESKGTDLPYDWNCFAFPISDGAWIVYRYSQRAKENELWGATPSGWTYCTLNKLPDFSSICKQFGGVKTKSGAFKFGTARKAAKAIRALGIHFVCPEKFELREITLTPGRLDNEIVLNVPMLEDDQSLADWYRTRGPAWEKVIQTVMQTKVIEPPDDIVRHVTSCEGGSQWYVKSRDRWIMKAKSDVKSALVAFGVSKGSLEETLGNAVVEDWQETIVPFGPEYPGNRQWNRKAPQFICDPKEGSYPTWSLILDHIGSSLNIKDNEWCSRYGIESGSHYLLLWLACVVRHPLSQLPYLFLVSTQQNTGKSIFHESFSLLLKDSFGYTKADHALTNNSGFNAELYGAVMAVVEEVDLSKSQVAYERIKDFVTSKNLFIRRMHQNGFMAPNTTHWVHCANDPGFCPIFPGDTRITVIYVNELQKEIPKEKMLELLKEEAPAFLHTLLTVEIPPSDGRLRIPVIESDLKGTIQEANRDRVSEFIQAQCEVCPGNLVQVSDFIREFHSWVEDPTEKVSWSERRILKNIPVDKFPRGKYGSTGRTFIGNLKVKTLQPYQIKGDIVIRKPDGRLGGSNE